MIDTLNELVIKGIMRFDPETNSYIEIEPEISSASQSSDNLPLVWQADNYSNRFENIMNSNDWVEKIDGRNVFEFSAVRFDKINGLILFDPHRQIYVGLTSHNSLYGTSEDSFSPLYIGKWLNSDYESRLNKLVNQTDSEGKFNMTA